MAIEDKDVNLDELPVAEPDPELASKVIFNDNKHDEGAKTKD